MLFRTVWMVFLSGVLLSPQSLSAQAQSSEAKTKDLPEDKGEEIVGTVCQQCHGLESITSSKHTLGEWRDLVTYMVSLGAQLQDEEVEIVAQYLAKKFGPERPSAHPKEGGEASSKSKINVNKSTAKELETDLGLSDKEANALVAYREKRGNFKSWEDLKKVADLDTVKMEAAKDRLVF